MTLSAALALMALILLSPGAARAQPEVELFGGASVWQPRLDTVYDASYTPSRVVGINQLFGDPDPRSRADQRLPLRAAAGPAGGLGLNVFIRPTLGLQVLVDRAQVGLAGRGSTHQVDLTFDTIAFPASTPIVSTLGYAFDVPPVRGYLDETVVSLNGVVRLFPRGAATVSVSGGLSVDRVTLAGEELQAFAAWLGGHAVVFSELYALTFRSTPAHGVGFNLGATVGVPLGRRLALHIDGRLFRARPGTAAIELEGVRSSNVVAVPVEQIERFLSLPDLPIGRGSLRLLVGLGWRL